MTTSPAQIAANRLNASLSTGPVSPSGTQISSRNATKHGILSRSVLSPHEDPALFAAHLQSFSDDLCPVGALEEMLCEQIACCSWRLTRLLAWDADLVGRHQEALATDPETLDYHGTLLTFRPDPVPPASSLDPLLRYEKALTGQIHRCLAQLQQHQQHRLSQPSVPEHPSPVPAPAPTSDETNPIPPSDPATPSTTASTDTTPTTPQTPIPTPPTPKPDKTNPILMPSPDLKANFPYLPPDWQIDAPYGP
ncbi:MAG TPA: hypothetical protein VKV02_06595 [Acidobacteriaceae bacterium]|nr:hypothetical protein [Acidobacteriaceae bacterium]